MAEGRLCVACMRRILIHPLLEQGTSLLRFFEHPFSNSSCTGRSSSKYELNGSIKPEHQMYEVQSGKIPRSSYKISCEKRDRGMENEAIATTEAHWQRKAKLERSFGSGILPKRHTTVHHPNLNPWNSERGKVCSA
ncbi:uncharacterized protein [Macrobrachium rosenbergii]|uniref:uncharacterized protein isoform X2 n=1 Tax=Macrobrachium rosenbergii TaxID=79674 RepID=UPI0034D47E0D